jgi:DNA-binding IclR family transcriptional regulator
VANGIQSVVIGFRLLKAVVDEDEPISLKALAAKADLSASKARGYLISLIETGMIAQHSQSGFYMLGPYAMHLASRAIKRVDLIAVAAEAGRLIRDSSGAHVLISGWSTRGITILSSVEGAGALPFYFRIGGTASLVTSATGHVVLAYGHPSETKPCLEAELKAMAISQSEMKKTRAKLDTHVQKVKREGVGYVPQVTLVTGVALNGFAAVAAPIFGEAHQLRLVITALFQTENKGLDKAAMAEIIKGACSRASTMAGGNIG